MLANCLPGSQILVRVVVRAEGLEPPQLSSLEPKSSASTNSATPAKEQAVRRRCRGRRAYNTQVADGSKKMTRCSGPTGWTRDAKNGPAISMMRASLRPSRRQLLAGLSAGAAAAIWRRSAAQTAASPAAIAMRPDASGKVVFDPAPPASFRLGERLRLTLRNGLSERIGLGIRGLDGIQAVEPLLPRAPLEPGQSTAIDIDLAQ